MPHYTLAPAAVRAWLATSLVLVAALGVSSALPKNETAPTRLAIVVPKGCHLKIHATEEMHEDCIRILKDHRYSQTHSARGEIHTSGCGAFPAFRTVGAKLGYKVPPSPSPSPCTHVPNARLSYCNAVIDRSWVSRALILSRCVVVLGSV